MRLGPSFVKPRPGAGLERGGHEGQGASTKLVHDAPQRPHLSTAPRAPEWKEALREPSLFGELAERAKVHASHLGPNVPIHTSDTHNGTEFQDQNQVDWDCVDWDTSGAMVAGVPPIIRPAGSATENISATPRSMMTTFSDLMLHFAPANPLAMQGT